MNQGNNMDARKTLANIIKTGNIIDKRTATFSIAKLFEESGEFAQASLAKSGFTNKKKLKHNEQVFEEAADSFIMILDTIGKVYKDQLESGNITEKKLIDKIFKWIPIKMQKWEKVVSSKKNYQDKK
jgi:NTP pyrophosphatase (non-canonical NTP hydrolase)